MRTTLRKVSMKAKTLQMSSFLGSALYSRILSAVRNSPYYTDHSDKACLFVLPYDTLDRDRLSSDINTKLVDGIGRLPAWQNGSNHLLFLMYYGTYPHYDYNDVGFDRGRAIVASASFAASHYRPYFDIAWPLFHKSKRVAKDLPQNAPFQTTKAHRRQLQHLKSALTCSHSKASATHTALAHVCVMLCITFTMVWMWSLRQRANTDDFGTRSRTRGLFTSINFPFRSLFMQMQR